MDVIFKLNEMGRALSIYPATAIELAQEVQEVQEVRKLERQVDAKYRAMIIKALGGIPDTKDLLLFKDAVEGIEGMLDKCQEAADSFTILALGM